MVVCHWNDTIKYSGRCCQKVNHQELRSTLNVTLTLLRINVQLCKYIACNVYCTQCVMYICVMQCYINLSVEETVDRFRIAYYYICFYALPDSYQKPPLAIYDIRESFRHFTWYIPDLGLIISKHLSWPCPVISEKQMHLRHLCIQTNDTLPICNGLFCLYIPCNDFMCIELKMGKHMIPISHQKITEN